MNLQRIVLVLLFVNAECNSASTNLLCPNRIRPDDPNGVLREEAEYNEINAINALRSLSKTSNPVNNDSLSVIDGFNMIDGYRLKLDALYERKPDSKRKFCKWLEDYGYEPD